MRYCWAFSALYKHFSFPAAVATALTAEKSSFYFCGQAVLLVPTHKNKLQSVHQWVTISWTKEVTITQNWSLDFHFRPQDISNSPKIPSSWFLEKVIKTKKIIWLFTKYNGIFVIYAKCPDLWPQNLALNYQEPFMSRVFSYRNFQDPGVL